MRTNVRFSARYRPTGPVYAATPGSLEHFLTERLPALLHFSAALDVVVWNAEVVHPSAPGA
jgi:uncharacterized protein YqjF (DUF2071 family)